MAETKPKKSELAEQPNNKSLKLPQVFDSNYKDFIIVHIFDAPRSLLFKMFADPKHFKNWFGPYSCTIPTCEIDFKLGGKISVLIKTNNGFSSPLDGIFYEIVENKKLVYSFGGYKGPNNESKVEFLNTITFDDHNGKTKLTLVSQVIKAELKESEMAVKGMMEGWPQSLAKLETYLQNINF